MVLLALPERRQRADAGDIAEIATAATRCYQVPAGTWQVLTFSVDSIGIQKLQHHSSNIGQVQVADLVFMQWHAADSGSSI